jgi:alkanesulfonate monooxygenase
MLESYTLLGALAGVTEQVRLGTLVTGNTYRNPAILAKCVTTLDIVSGGRAQLGIGSGWFELEHDAFGIEFGTFTDRFEKLEESLQIVLPMLRGEKANLEGKWYRAKDAHNVPAPVGRIPVMIGGGGEKKTLRMVAQYAQACNLFAGPELPHKLDVLREHCATLGRDYDEIEKTVMMTLDPGENGENADALLEQLGALAALGITHVQGRVPDAARPGRFDVFAERIVPEAARL